jgi:hypothetical protein
MKHIRRETSNPDARPRSHASCYLALGMAGSLGAALLGLIYDERAVWAAGLACFGLLCLQVVVGYWLSRERPVVAVQIAITSAPLSTSTL